MKKFLFVIGLLFSLSLAGQSLAAVVSLNPAGQQITPGGVATVDLNVSGLGDFAPPSLGAFQLDITFDSTVLAFDSVVFGSFLGDPLLDALTFDSLSAGNLYLDEVSLMFDFELDALQPAAFTLATISFTGLGAGFSPLNLQNVVLSDAAGSAITGVTLQNAGVTAVPVPGALLLFGSGLCGIAGLRRKTRMVA